MKNSSLVFSPDWPRIFIETALQEVFSELSSTNSRCLNVGCGTSGRYSELLSGFEVDGVDIADPQEKSFPWRYHRCDASSLPFSDSEFDLAFAIESFEHIENNKQAMLEIFRTLKPGGLLVITTPTDWTWLFEFGRHGPHYYGRNDLLKLVEDSGFELNYCKPCGGMLFWFANLFKSWLSPIGLRIFGGKWWSLIDKFLTPVYMLSIFTDKLLEFLPSNWFVVAVKKNINS